MFNRIILIYTDKNGWNKYVNAITFLDFIFKQSEGMLKIRDCKPIILLIIYYQNQLVHVYVTLERPAARPIKINSTQCVTWINNSIVSQIGKY